MFKIKEPKKVEEKQKSKKMQSAKNQTAQFMDFSGVSFGQHSTMGLGSEVRGGDRPVYGVMPIQSMRKSGITTADSQAESIEKAPNETGIPNGIKNQFEAMSGLSFDDVRIHYSSKKPEELGALAYTQGKEVYIAPGQERHLPHELGHVVQQKQGRVTPPHILGVCL